MAINLQTSALTSLIAIEDFTIKNPSVVERPVSTAYDYSIPELLQLVVLQNLIATIYSLSSFQPF